MEVSMTITYHFPEVFKTTVFFYSGAKVFCKVSPFVQFEGALEYCRQSQHIEWIIKRGETTLAQSKGV